MSFGFPLGFTGVAVAELPPVLLLHMEGADGSTTFTDSSASAHTVTANAGAQIDTAQSKFGGSSAYSGGIDWLGLDASTDFDFPSGTNFTIDFWVRLSDVTTLCSFYNHHSTYFDIYCEAGVIKYYSNAVVITGSTSLVVNTWHHIALTRAGLTTRLFLDGVLQGSYGDVHNYTTDAGAPLLLSRASYYGVPLWMDEVRVIKGWAAWTANFTPPTSPYT